MRRKVTEALTRCDCCKSDYHMLWMQHTYPVWSYTGRDKVAQGRSQISKISVIMDIRQITSTNLPAVVADFFEKVSNLLSVISWAEFTKKAPELCVLKKCKGLVTSIAWGLPTSDFFPHYWLTILTLFSTISLRGGSYLCEGRTVLPAPLMGTHGKRSYSLCSSLNA